MDCWLGQVENCNALHSVEYIRNGVGCNGVPNFNKKTLKSFHKESLAYSWNVGTFLFFIFKSYYGPHYFSFRIEDNFFFRFFLGVYHFVQLHFYPEYESASIDIKTSMEWLENDLINAKKQNLYTILFIHSIVDTEDDLKNILKNKNVIVILAAHVHRCVGKTCEMPIRTRGSWFSQECDLSGSGVYGHDDYGGDQSWFYTDPSKDSLKDSLKDSAGNDAAADKYYCAKAGIHGFLYLDYDERIPVMWSGSSSFQTFLYVNFNEEEMTVDAMSSINGTPTYLSDLNLPTKTYPYHKKKDMTLTINLNDYNNNKYKYDGKKPQKYPVPWPFTLNKKNIARPQVKKKVATASS